ncbi:MAG: serine hydrolase [Gemmatimonadetes bacterium]|jgi:hypothetical protein|nr:serine hydrolase [Gemmatimonadota bacterium]
MSTDLFAEARGRIRREMSESCIPSMAVTVARDGEILWEEAFGWADCEKRIPATEHTPYSLASSQLGSQTPGRRSQRSNRCHCRQLAKSLGGAAKEITRCEIHRLDSAVRPGVTGRCF